MHGPRRCLWALWWAQGLELPAWAVSFPALTPQSQPGSPSKHSQSNPTTNYSVLFPQGGTEERGLRAAWQPRAQCSHRRGSGAVSDQRCCRGRNAVARQARSCPPFNSADCLPHQLARSRAEQSCETWPGSPVPAFSALKEPELDLTLHSLAPPCLL